MRHLLPICLIACGGAALDDTGSAEDTAGTVYPIDDLAPYSGGTCPTLIAGHQDIVSDGLTRDVRIELPANPVGAPVVFAWHWLGGSADQIMQYGGFSTWPNAHGAIVVAPESQGLPVEWDTWSGADNSDTVLFDDVTRCLAEQYTIDLDRVYSTGFSAGAMWTVSLTHHRSEVLAATAPLSGGATITTWAPEATPPMLLTWGGPTDTYGTYSFETGTLDLGDQLAAVGQFHAMCVHSGGHTLPSTGTGYVWEFFEAHPRGVISPWTGGLPASMPSMCSLP